MAIAAVAHVFVFSAKAYHFLPASKYGQVSPSTIKEFVKVEEGDEDKPAIIEKTETQIEAPGTSVTESVQEIVVEGGQHVSSCVPNINQLHKIKIELIHSFLCLQVVDDVKMTLNQAIEPVGKGMTKIQETIHHLSVGDDDKKSEIEVDEYEKDVTKIGPDGSGEDNEKIEVRVEKDEEVSRNGTHLTRQTSEVTVEEYKHG